jgi:hypothetical protein
VLFSAAELEPHSPIRLRSPAPPLIIIDIVDADDGSRVTTFVPPPTLLPLLLQVLLLLLAQPLLRIPPL